MKWSNAQALKRGDRVSYSRGVTSPAVVTVENVSVNEISLCVERGAYVVLRKDEVESGCLNALKNNSRNETLTGKLFNI